MTILVTKDELISAIEQIRDEGYAVADDNRIDRESQLAIMRIEKLPNTILVALGIIIMERRQREKGK